MIKFKHKDNTGTIYTLDEDTLIVSWKDHPDVGSGKRLYNSQTITHYFKNKDWIIVEGYWETDTRPVLADSEWINNDL